MLFAKVATFAAALLYAAASSDAAPLQGNNSPELVLPNAYLVEVPAGQEPKAFVLKELDSRGIKQSDVKFRQVIQTKFFSGASFEIKKSESSDNVIEAASFLRSFRVGKRFRPTPKVSSASSLKFAPEDVHSLTGVNAARARYGATGKGIKVAIIDTGVDYLHPALGGGFGPGFKVAYGYDLVGDAYTGDDAFIVPDDDPMDDCNDSGHGTHVAGIVAGNTFNVTDPAFRPPVDFTGVAPDAILGAYRVFGCSGSTSTDTVAASIYRAAADGSDVINLSLGGGPVFADDADAYAVEVVSKAGHIVVAANGNSQADGLMSYGSPGVAREGFGIASFDNVAVPSPSLTVDDAPFPFSPGQLNGNFQFNTPYEIVVNDLDADANDKQDDGSAAVPTINARGKALLIRWGNTAFGGSVRRCNYAVNAGAVACILYNNLDGGVFGIFGAADIPSLATTRAAGLAIINAIKAGKTPKFIVTDKQVNFPIPTAGTVSDFSSLGLDAELFIKPDLGGIGGEVLSTMTRFVGESTGSNYAVYSGTSMATPYVAGAIALYLESKGKTPFRELRTVLQNTAKPAKIFQSPLVDSVVRQGAGLINIYDALSTKTIVTPSALHLNDTQYASQHYPITITNNDDKPVTYTVSSLGAAMVTAFIPGDDAVQPISTTKFTGDYADIKFNRLNDRVPSVNVTVPAKSSRNVNVHVQPPASAIAGLYPIYSGFVRIAVAGEAEPVASVPFAGMVGRWRDAPIWVRKSPIFANQWLFPNFPGLNPNTTFSTGVYSSALDFAPLPAAGTTLNLTDGAAILHAAATNSRYIKIEIVFAGTDAEKRTLPGNIRHKTPLGYMVSGDGAIQAAPQWARSSPNPASQSFLGPQFFGWFGDITTDATSVEAAIKLPPATYRVKFSGLKHFGRVGAKGDSNYDVILSPPIKVVY
ncbi:hypothetical protein HDU96_003866 [Phlyctochytrium bullatum]|nr:hypothetical protein HDU96_003866 [Phlyctochytrium bullatum]